MSGIYLKMQRAYFIIWNSSKENFENMNRYSILEAADDNKYIFEEEELQGINYRLNTTYVIENNLRKWKKVDVKFIERHTNSGLENVKVDEDGDYLFFYDQVN